MGAEFGRAKEDSRKCLKTLHQQQLGKRVGEGLRTQYWVPGTQYTVKASGLKLQRIAPLVGEAAALHRKAAAIWFVVTLATSNREQHDYPDGLRDLQKFLDCVLIETFHRRGVVAQSLGHPHERR